MALYHLQIVFEIVVLVGLFVGFLFPEWFGWGTLQIFELIYREHCDSMGTYCRRQNDPLLINCRRFLL